MPEKDASETIPAKAEKLLQGLLNFLWMEVITFVGFLFWPASFQEHGRGHFTMAALGLLKTVVFIAGSAIIFVVLFNPVLMLVFPAVPGNWNNF